MSAAFRSHGGLDGKPPRATPEIREEIQGINDLLYGRRGERRIVDTAIRRSLGRRRRECQDELIEAGRRLRDGE